MTQIEIGFIGYDSTDIVLYTARLFSASGKKVAVIDYTNKQLMFRVTALADDSAQNTGFYKDILILNGFKDNKKDKASQDVLLYYFGYHHDHKDLKKCPNVVFVTDMAVSNAQLLKDVDLEDSVSVYLIIRNYASFKYDEKYLSEVIGRQFDADHVLLIPFDETDYKSGCYLCIDKKHRLSSLSRSMKMAVLNLFNDTSGMEYKRKEQNALLKRA